MGPRDDQYYGHAEWAATVTILLTDSINFQMPILLTSGTLHRFQSLNKPLSHCLINLFFYLCRVATRQLPDRVCMEFFAWL